ncbi:hypothetical protein [Paraliobacillus salinarum]|uniref:hypothetical protein n=1 Tax=Paraliobacillus salinarum TaxID=1158996 RepID=UPI0015F54BBC|nr:hypothetical protein [Paraliobacillus salinarum]
MMGGGHMGSFGNNNGGFYGYNEMHSASNWFDGMFTNSFMSFILLILILIVLYMIFKNRKQQTMVSPNQKKQTTVIEAEEAAKLRYARGEISLEEFQSIIQTIRA